MKQKAPKMELIPITSENYERVSWPAPHGTSFKLTKDKKYGVTKFTEMGPLGKDYMLKNGYRRIYYFDGDDVLKYYVYNSIPLPHPIDAKTMYEIVDKNTVPKALRNEIMIAYVIDNLGRLLKPKTREHFGDIFSELS